MAKTNMIHATIKPDYQIYAEDIGYCGRTNDFCYEYTGSDIKELIDRLAKALTTEQIPVNEVECWITLEGGTVYYTIAGHKFDCYIDDACDVPGIMGATELRKKVKASTYYKVKPQATGYKLDKLLNVKQNLEIELARLTKQIQSLEK